MAKKKKASEGKPFYKSKTVWFNILTAIIVIAGMLGYDVDNAMTSELATSLIAVSPVVNLVLRGWTKSPIKLK